MRYIPADKLIAEIEKKKKILISEYNELVENEVWISAKENKIKIYTISDILSLIDSLQQEQPEFPNGKFVFPKYLFARTKDNKTIDMSYAPQDMSAVEYVRNDLDEQEQPEVDLEKEINDYMYPIQPWEVQEEPFTSLEKCARYFYELGLNVRKV